MSTIWRRMDLYATTTWVLNVTRRWQMSNVVRNIYISRPCTPYPDMKRCNLWSVHVRWSSERFLVRLISNYTALISFAAQCQSAFRKKFIWTSVSEKFQLLRKRTQHFVAGQHNSFVHRHLPTLLCARDVSVYRYQRQLWICFVTSIFNMDYRHTNILNSVCHKPLVITKILVVVGNSWTGEYICSNCI